eukprot:8640-Heterococcus_DN1.PRE.1
MLIWRSVGCVAALSATALRPTLRLYSSASFQEQLDSHQDVRLASGTVITLDERVSLKAHKLNRIFGEGDGATIIGSGHSIIQLADCGRTGLVGLGTGSATLQRTAVNSCAVHGVCVRGSTSLLAEDCTFSNNGVRAVYAYGKPHLTLRDCTVHSTKALPYMATVQGQAAAVEIDSKIASDSVTLHIQRLRSVNNAGTAVRISGQVRYSLQDCTVDGHSISSSSSRITESNSNSSGVQILAHEQLQPIEIEACSEAASTSDNQTCLRLLCCVLTLRCFAVTRVYRYLCGAARLCSASSTMYMS